MESLDLNSNGRVNFGAATTKSTLPMLSCIEDPWVMRNATGLLPCGTTFLRVLISAVFLKIRKKSSREKKFPAKIYSTVEIIYKTSPLTCNVKSGW